MNGTPMDERLFQAAMLGNTDKMQDLVLNENANILVGTTSQGSTCLHISSIFGHQEFSMAVLAQNHSLLSSINSYGETPLIAALTSGHVSLASAMLKQYQQLNLSYETILKQDINGNSALHHAIRDGHSDLAQELIEAEPGLSQGLNKYNESPMYMAALRGFNDVLERLLKIPLSSHVGTFNENALHAAVRNGNPGIAKYIVEVRPSLVREGNQRGNTPMHQAVLWNKRDVVQALLKQNRSLGYLVSTTDDVPLLYSAALRGHVSIAEEILNYCPDAPYCTQDGWTMLHQAVHQGHEEFVLFVLKTPQLYKLINMRNKDGETALHIAVRNCNPKIVGALLAHSVTDLTVLNNRGISTEGPLAENTERAKSLNWNKVLMMMSKADPQALTFISSQTAKKEITDKSIKEIRLLTQTYTNNTSLVAILIATITFGAAFTLPGGYNNEPGAEGLPVMARKAAFKAFLISDTLAMCSSLAAAFICILARWEDLEFLLYYRSFTKKLMWFAYMATTVAFATGLYTVVAPRILWLAIIICILSIGLPFLTKLLGEWPLLKFRFQLGHKFQSEFLDMV
ncbi:hypothetical protein LUZ63_016722 [Rhynchospora breviuscula]|uniref:PGG domain-containing protein n=1 Tax=Rhynchospora breviuscula TaxID=2022672 RepID=A0A9P9ZCU9_9POAL|nr:hypothetical protein LUZ63_016722 [Rhynchospora breviuscula]